MGIRWLRYALALSVPASCTLVDSVDGYSGPPKNGGDAGEDVPGEICENDSDCEDNNPCTLNPCTEGRCQRLVQDGKSCSDDNPCNGEEFCDEAGICVLGAPDSFVQCGGDPCPSGYFVSRILCTEDCAPSGFGVNAFRCEKICGNEIRVCCGNCETPTCPPGYTMGAVELSDCVDCGPQLSAVVCNK